MQVTSLNHFKSSAVFLAFVMSSAPVAADTTCPLCGGSGTVPSKATESMTNLVQMQTVYQGPATLLADWPDMPIWLPTDYFDASPYWEGSSDLPIVVYPGPGNPGMPLKQIAAALKANEVPVFHDPRDVITDPVQQLFYPSEISGTSFDMKVAGTPPHDGPYAPWNKMVATFTQDLPERAGPSGPFLSIALNCWERDPMLPGVSFHYEGAASVFTDPRDIDITWTALEGAKPPPFNPSPTSPYPEGTIAAIDLNAAQTSMGRQAGLWWSPEDVPPICRGKAGPIPEWCLVAAGANRGPTAEEWSTVMLNGFTPSIADVMIESGRGDHIIPLPF